MKAFDTVCYRELLNVLKRKGFRGVSYQLIKGYLCNRIQHVKLSGVISEPFPIKYELPQDTVLELVVFTLYITDLLEIKSEGTK